MEAIIEPDLEIIDAHHHVRDRPNDRYLFPDLHSDLASGHNIIATVAVECGDMYRAYGPPVLRSVGEVEFLAGIAAMFASGRYGPTLACDGMVGYADLRLGADAQGVIDALLAASGGRLCGIRNIAAWHASHALQSNRTVAKDLLEHPGFRQGVNVLASNDLALDVWVYHTQLRNLAALARACPRTTIVLNHLGGPLLTGPYASLRDVVFAEWRDGLREVANCPNVVCKLGGLGQRIVGLKVDRPPSQVMSEELASLWQPYFFEAIDCFGVQRCMLESNFPTDSVASTYAVVWNAFKRMTAEFAKEERAALFRNTAARIYRLQNLRPM